LKSKDKFPESRKAAVASPPSSLKPPHPTPDASGPAAAPPTHPVAAPVSAFPVDKVEEPRRGPGRPPKVCEKCGKLAGECKGHAEQKFSIGEETVKGLITMVSQLAAYSFALSTDVPIERLGPVWSFTEGEKMVLVPPTAELINKNAPEWLLKYETEIKLGLIAIPLLIAKLAATHALVKAYKQKPSEENSTPSPAAGTPPRASQPAQAAAA
jgi:hypothetical protein